MRCAATSLLLLATAAQGTACGCDAPDLLVLSPYTDTANAPIATDGSFRRALMVTEAGNVLRATAEVIVQHERPDDLTISVQAPSGASAELGGRIVECGDHYRYAVPLLALQGEAAMGTWALLIADTRTDVTGTLVAWTIGFEALQ